MKRTGMARKPVIAALLILSALVATYVYRTRSTPSETIYAEANVERGSIHTTVVSTGVVEPENRVEVKSSIAGRAEEVLVTEGARVRKGRPLVWMSSTERAALLDAARARGPEELRKWDELYRPIPILAPVDGTIIQRKIEPGQTFSVTDPILVMSDRLIVEAQVDETDLAKIHIGQKARIALDAYPNQPVPGRVGTIAYEATTVNNVTTYIVKVIPDEVPEFIRSGMTANVNFEVASRNEVLLVPSSALVVADGAFAVLKKSNNPKEPPRSYPVEVGLNDGKRTEIIKGVEEGETVLIPQATNSGPASANGGTNPFAPPRIRRGQNR